MTIEEATAALAQRRASVGRGLMEQVVENGGGQVFSIDELRGANRTALVGLDVRGDELDAAAVKAVEVGSYIDAGWPFLTSFSTPELQQQVLRTMIATAWADGYIVRAIQEAHEEPAPPCPHCGSEATEENPATEVSGAMICADCGCRWRP